MLIPNDCELRDGAAPRFTQRERKIHILFDHVIVDADNHIARTQVCERRRSARQNRVQEESIQFVFERRRFRRSPSGDVEFSKRRCLQRFAGDAEQGSRNIRLPRKQTLCGATHCRDGNQARGDSVYRFDNSNYFARFVDCHAADNRS